MKTTAIIQWRGIPTLILFMSWKHTASGQNSLWWALISPQSLWKCENLHWLSSQGVVWGGNMEALIIHGAFGERCRTVNQNYEHDGSLTCVITGWQQVMKMISFLFSPHNKQGRTHHSGMRLFPAALLALLCLPLTHIGRGIAHIKMQTHTHARTHKAHIFTSNI